MINLRFLRWPTESTTRHDAEDSHELLSEYESSDRPVLAKWTQPRKVGLLNFGSRNTRAKILYAIFIVALATILIALYQPRRVASPSPSSPPLPQFPWQDFRRLDGYYQGLGSLVSAEGFVPQNPNAIQKTSESTLSKDLHSKPASDSVSKLFAYQPRFKNLPPSQPGDLPARQQCFLRADDTIPAPSIHAFDGIPQNGVLPVFGSHEMIGLKDTICFERYGRYGPYGLGYPVSGGGTGLGIHGDQSLTQPIWEESGQIDWSSVDLGDAQERCRERNHKRYHPAKQNDPADHAWSLTDFEDVDWQKYRPLGENTTTVPRTAIVLRAWQGLEYKPAIKLYLRSLVNELSLQSGGEYQIHLLVEAKDVKRPIWTSKAAYDEVLAELVPVEFRSMATLWSQDLMQLIYPGPFEPQFHDHGSMYPAMRSMHFALQWFMIRHPEYEYLWNWEMDLRYIGHWYELFDSVSAWAKKQSRDHLWARNARYHIPALYNDWEEFASDTRQRSPVDITDKQEFRPNPTPGHEHDNEEEADFITFNPIFNPDNTEWNRREDVTGYDTTQPIPERRAAIVAASRFSRRLLLAMHHENFHNRHSMGSEMFPATMALHHGLKAVHVPHPVYFEHDWPAEYAHEIFNGGPAGDSGDYADSVFGMGPKGNYMALQQSTYYYEVQFAEFLWWRWLGYQDYRYNNEGGADYELKKDQNGIRKGRMCLRSMLFHPIKNDEGRSF